MAATQIRAGQEIQQAPVQILQGPAHRDDGYQIREDLGFALNDAQYKKAMEAKETYSKNATDYKKDATEKLNAGVATAQQKLATLKPPEPFRKPEETVFYAFGHGGGNDFQKYVLPKAAAGEIVKAYDNGYYKVNSAETYEQLRNQNDFFRRAFSDFKYEPGAYYIDLREMGAEGYTALNEAQQAYHDQLNVGERTYRSGMSAYNNAVADARGAIKTAETGGRTQIEDQYKYLSGLFGEEAAKSAIEWTEKKKANTESIQALVAGGVLAPKKVQVI